MSVRNQIRLLAKLQGILSEKDALAVQLEAIPEKLRQLDAEKEQFLQELETCQEQLEAANKKYRDMELEIRLSSEQIAKSDARLRAVKTNKAYQATLKEIEDFHKTNSKIEDEMIGCLETIETAKETVKVREADFELFQGRLKNELAELEKTKEGIQARIKAITVRYEEVVKEIEAGHLRKFNMIFAQKPDHVAVAPAIGAVCMGCNMNIPPQLYNELQREESVRMCPHCQRIIYWEDV